MKKIKLILVATAILLSIGGAFATRSHVDCRFSQQYYLVGSAYLPTGPEGVTYICEAGPGVCTYVQVGNNTYQACQQGVYFAIH